MQAAVNVTFEPTIGFRLLVVSEHATFGDPAPACQPRLTPAGALEVELLLAVTK